LRSRGYINNWDLGNLNTECGRSSETIRICCSIFVVYSSTIFCGRKTRYLKRS
jgi:hypothetical protein